MDIVKLTAQVGDIAISGIGGGELMRRLKDALPEDKHIDSSTTGFQLRDLYQELEVADRKKLDAAIQFTDKPEIMVDIFNELDHIETQRNAFLSNREETRSHQKIVFYLIAILLTSYGVFSYHNHAKQEMGDKYSSTLVTVLSEIVNMVNTYQEMSNSTE